MKLSRILFFAVFAMLIISMPGAIADEQDCLDQLAAVCVEIDLCELEAVALEVESDLIQLQRASKEMELLFLYHVKFALEKECEDK